MAPGIRVSRRAQAASRASATLAVTLSEYQREHKLTDVEMLQALTSWQQTTLKYMLRAERHPEDPDKPADLA
jgi:hypothetical protein